MLSLAFFLTVHRNDNACQLGTRTIDYLHRFTYSRAGSNDVVNK